MWSMFGQGSRKVLDQGLGKGSGMGLAMVLDKVWTWLSARVQKGFRHGFEHTL